MKEVFLQIDTMTIELSILYFKWLQEKKCIKTHKCKDLVPNSHTCEILPPISHTYTEQK